MSQSFEAIEKVVDKHGLKVTHLELEGSSYYLQIVGSMNVRYFHYFEMSDKSSASSNVDDWIMRFVLERERYHAAAKHRKCD
jgi:hypothetical protein